MKRVITALLAALLVLSLAACGSGVETKKLAGTWTCTIDVTDRMNAAAEQALGLSAPSARTLVMAAVSSSSSSSV